MYIVFRLFCIFVVVHWDNAKWRKIPEARMNSLKSTCLKQRSPLYTLLISSNLSFFLFFKIVEIVEFGTIVLSCKCKVKNEIVFFIPFT